MATIPGLPDNLATVPGYTPGDGGQWRRDWAQWRDQILVYRAQMLDLCAKHPDMQLLEREKCRRSPAYLLNTYGWIFEPRERDGRPPGWYPWVLYAFQVDLIDTIMVALGTRGRLGSLVIEKARDMGATWTVCGVVAHGWLFGDAFLAGLISYKEDLVDAEGDPDSMFYKVEGLLGMLPGGEAPGVPRWMFPHEYRHEEHNRKLRIKHPTKPNTIKGEPTTSRTGRGGRNFLRVNDEAAQFEGLSEILVSQTANTDHIISLSSANLRYGDDFYQMARKAKEGDGFRYVRLDWWLHPGHDEAWYHEEKARYDAAGDPEGFAREVLIDYHAGEGGWVYRDYVEHKQPGAYPYVSGWPLYVFCDPGHADKTVLHWVQSDPHSTERRLRLVQTYANAGKPAAFYAHILTGIFESGPDSFEFTDDDLQIMEWTLTLPTASYFGDPAGKQKTAASGVSFYDIIARTSRDLYHRQGRSGVIVFRTADLDAQRQHHGRQSALRELLPRLDFNDTPGVRVTHEALMLHHTQRIREGRERISPPKPVHDWTFDYVSALEFGAVNLALRPATTNGKRPGPILTDIGGKTLSRLRPMPRLRVG